MLLETICIHNNQAVNIHLHTQRMQNSAKNLGFVAPHLPNLVDIMPRSLANKRVRCSIKYGTDIIDILFVEYTPRVIRSLKVIEADISYSLKFADRHPLNQLLLQKGYCDEVLVVRDNFITDTTFSNVVFENSEGLFTPDTYLLNGIKRQKLIAEGVVKETRISQNDLHKYSRVHLVNAMLDIGMSVVNIRNIR
ncbi:MAG: hypothetical protein GXZ03_05640 [Proteiniphilum sp.]|nr:hypothetical protein [Proteiniphilum sp.]